jgi:sulfite oxidase
MEVVGTPFRGYYHAERYILVDASGQTLGSVREMPVKSVIAWPTKGESVPMGAHTIFGFAWSAYGPILRVDVSTDDEQTWAPARLLPAEGPLAWTRWEANWDAGRRGHVTIASRATDSAGNVQPSDVPWNRFGYLMNAIVRRRIAVE